MGVEEAERERTVGSGRRNRIGKELSVERGSGHWSTAGEGRGPWNPVREGNGGFR